MMIASHQKSIKKVKVTFFLGLGLLIALISYSVLKEQSIAKYEYVILFSAALAALIFDYLKTSYFLTLIGKHRDDRCSLDFSVNEALKTTLKSPLLLKLVGIELLTLYYAFFAKAEHDDPVCKNSLFSYRKSSNANDVFLFFALSQLPFLPFIHIFLEHLKGPIPAWVVSLLTLWSVIWYLAQVQAVRFRPVELSGDHLKYRFGLFWLADIPIREIKRARIIDPFDKPDEDDLFLSPLGSKRNVFLEFENPILFRGPYLLRKRTRKAAISIDEPSRFLGQLEIKGVVTV